MTGYLPLLLVALMLAGAALFVWNKNRDRSPAPAVRDYPQYVVVPCKGLPLSGWLHIAFDAVGPFPDDATFTPYFQREGDDWTARGAMETYRWWASFATQPLRVGHYDLTVPLDANWTAVLSSSRDTQRDAYLAALANAHRAGFTIGNSTGLGHGDNPKGAIENVSIAVG